MTPFPTAYFGPIAYYRELVNCADAAIEVKEHFVKQTIRTRCEILGPNGKQLLSIPVERIHGNKTAVEDLKIIQDGWKKIHWRSIETAYNSSAYFDYYGMEIKELLDTPFERLIDFNEAIEQRIFSWLDIDLTIPKTSSFEVNPILDYRVTKFDTEGSFTHDKYHQVFREKQDCMCNLSILDLILNQGPMARNWIVKQER